MKEWKLLSQWAEKRLPAQTITLVKASAGFESLVGCTAVMEEAGAAPCGSLLNTPFWAEDWLAVLAEAAKTPAPPAGTLLAVSGRHYYYAPLSSERTALILGGGHVGGALSRLLSFLDYQVTIMDDRPDFLKNTSQGISTLAAPFEELSTHFSQSRFDAVIIVTRGHAQDTACLRQVLAWQPLPPYVGMIGSRRRTAETIKMLASDGFEHSLLARIHTPIGLNIGAETPQEIAVSIAAEVTLTLNKDFRKNISHSE